MSSDRFPLAPMSTGICALTAALLVLPVGLIIAGLWTRSPIAFLPASILILLYLVVWLYFRPTRFGLSGGALDIVWPVRRLKIPLATVTAVERPTAQVFRKRYGLGLRVGVGGLWGGFGLLVTRQGTLRFYVSRLDGYVLIHNSTTRPLLITPSDPVAFARSLWQRREGTGPPSSVEMRPDRLTPA